jgi:ABC-2 type transport system ATP-binding protein
LPWKPTSFPETAHSSRRSPRPGQLPDSFDSIFKFDVRFPFQNPANCRIEFAAVSKKYGHTLALNRLTLTVEPGEFFALIGPNAAGKTTAIRLLAGREKPSRGRVRVCGLELPRKIKQARGFLGYMPEFTPDHEQLTINQFVTKSASVLGLDESVVMVRAGNLFERFQLDRYLNQKIGGLSLGTQQKAGMVVALLNDPRVIVLDEPLVGIDPRQAELVQEELVERTRQGAIVFLSTHVLELVERLATRVGVLQRGTLIATGSPNELRGQDRTLEEAYLRLVRR